MSLCVTVQFVPKTEAEVPYLFSESLVRPRLSRLPLAWSVLGHVFLLALLARSGDIHWFDTDRMNEGRYHVELIRLRVPERMYYPASAPRAEAATQTRAPQTTRPPMAQARPSAGGQGEPATAAGSPRSVEIPRRMELPSTRALAVDTALLQPDSLTPPVPLTTAVPPLAYWAQQFPMPRPTRAFIVPGRTNAPAPAPNLDAPPVLSVPN